MRFAVISDIHSNLYALTEVLKDIKNKDVEFIICTGDSVGYSPFPNEVVEELKKHHVISIKGNYDHAIGNSEESCGCGYTDPCMLDLASRSVNYTSSVSTEETKSYLRNLPDQFKLKIGDFSIVAVHGSPRKINEPVQEDSEVLLEILNEIEENVLIFGHTHKPFYKEYENIKSTKKFVINSGSVGKPAGGELRASYAMIEIVDNELKAEIFYVEYPKELAAKAIYDIPELPNDFGNILVGK